MEAFKCPSTDEWIMKMWYTHKKYSALMKNQTISFAGKWMDLEKIILNEVSQSQKEESNVNKQYGATRENTKV